MHFGSGSGWSDSFFKDTDLVPICDRIKIRPFIRKRIRIWFISNTDYSIILIQNTDPDPIILKIWIQIRLFFKYRSFSKYEFGSDLDFQFSIRFRIYNPSVKSPTWNRIEPKVPGVQEVLASFHSILPIYTNWTRLLGHAVQWSVHKGGGLNIQGWKVRASLHYRSEV